MIKLRSPGGTSREQNVQPASCRKLVEGLGDAVRVLSDEDVRESTYAQVAAGKGALAGMDNMLARQLAEAGRPPSCPKAPGFAQLVYFALSDKSESSG